MKIKELHIQNYKSLVDLKIVEPNPFSVFAGSNGAGKSNIFEALEFFSFCGTTDPIEAAKYFGGIDSIAPFRVFSEEIGEAHQKSFEIILSISLDKFTSRLSMPVRLIPESRIRFSSYGRSNFGYMPAEDSRKDLADFFQNWNDNITSPEYKQAINSLSRIFINNKSSSRPYVNDDSKINSHCSNLEKVLKRILADENKKDEIVSWLDLLIPGFENIEIVSEPLSGTDSLVIYEKGTNKPFTKNLLSDGTWNILALLTAVYQSDELQFLCIEEPENGLNPKVQKELVNLFRQKCEEGHYIWLNTHSQTIVNQLEPKELILVDKVDGKTKVKQLKDFDLHGLRMDEAWLTNSFGGGLPW